MSGTALAIPAGNLPAFLQRQEVMQQAEKFNAAAMGGLKSGGFPRLSIAGSKFFILDSSAEVPRQLITVEQQGIPVPAMVLSVVVVGANPGISKLYYEGAYVAGDDREPDCSSDDGVLPDSHILEPMHNACATCPMNAWGSKLTPEGKEVKACADNKRLVIIPAGDLSYKAMALTITPAMLKDWGAYMRALSNRNIPVHGVVTRLMFDSTVSYPKLNFSFERFLDEAEFARVMQRMDSDEVKNIEKPVRAPRQAPASLPAPAATIPAAPAHIAPATPTVSTTPAPAPAPATAAPAAVSPAPAPAPAPVDPLAGLSPEQVAAVNAVGGPSSPVGQTILVAFRASMPATTQAAVAVTAPSQDPAAAAAAAAVAAQPPAGRRGRPRKTQEAPAASPTPPASETGSHATASFGVQPQQTPPPAAPAATPEPAPAQAAPAQTGFATSPAAVIVPPGGNLGSQLDALLGDIMKS